MGHFPPYGARALSQVIKESTVQAPLEVILNKAAATSLDGECLRGMCPCGLTLGACNVVMNKKNKS